MHDEFINKYIIVKDDKTITLIPLPQKKMYHRHIKLERKGEARERKFTILFIAIKLFLENQR
jgi:hypothetical protein